MLVLRNPCKMQVVFNQFTTERGSPNAQPAAMVSATSRPAAAIPTCTRHAAPRTQGRRGSAVITGDVLKLIFMGILLIAVCMGLAIQRWPGR